MWLHHHDDTAKMKVGGLSQFLHVAYYIIKIIIILSFDIAPFPYKHAQRHITFHCQKDRC